MGSLCFKSYDVTPLPRNYTSSQRSGKKADYADVDRGSYIQKEGFSINATDTLTRSKAVINQNGNDFKELPLENEPQFEDVEEWDGHKGLLMCDLTDSIFRTICKKLGLKYISWEFVDFPGESISGSLYNIDKETIVGVRCIEITCEENGNQKKVKVALKSKLPGEKIAEKYVQMSYMAGSEAGAGMQRFIDDDRSVVRQNHLVEPLMAKKAMTDEVIGSISPEIYFYDINEEREKYFFIMEFIDREHYTHINTITQPGIDFFDEEATKKALQGIAIFHGAFLDRPARWKDFVLTDYLDVSKDYAEVFRGWGQFNLANCTDVLTGNHALLYKKLLKNIELILTELGKNKKTVVHNDFTPMNCCLRKNPGAGKQDLCAYDWEVMTLSVPQRDVIDFLTFGLMMAPADVALAGFKGYMEFYRLMLCHALSGRDDDFVELVTSEENFYRTVDYAFMLHMLERFASFMMISKVMPIPFLPMMANFLFSYLETIVDKYEFLQGAEEDDDNMNSNEILQTVVADKETENESEMHDHKGLLLSDLTDDIFHDICNKLGSKYISWEMVDFPGESISGTVYASDSKRITGVKCIEITCQENGNQTKIKVVLKSKAPGAETAEKYVQMSYMAGSEAGAGMQRFVDDDRSVILQNHLVEPLMAQKAMTDEVIGSISPEIYYVHIDKERERHFFFMEFLDRDHYTHINTITQPGIDYFDEEATKKALQGIAIFHGTFFDQPQLWNDLVVTDFLEISKDYPEVFRGWGKYNLAECPDVLTNDRAPLYQKLLDNVELIVTELGKNKKTVVHNDFTPMNCCLRKDPANGKQDLCAYDWEVMTLSVPQRDIIDFLTFSLMMAPADIALKGFKGYMEYYRNMLRLTLADRDEDFVESVTSETNFYRTVDYAFMLHMMERLANFMMISKVMPIPFLPMMANFLFSYLETIVDKYEFLQ